MAFLKFGKFFKKEVLVIKKTQFLTTFEKKPWERFTLKPTNTGTAEQSDSGQCFF